MTKVPDINGAKAIKAFEKDGWTVKSTKGGHVKLIKTGYNYFLIIPVHGKTIPKGTLASIIKDSGLSVQEFIDLL
jgi:predicted RNA binding protein YcfA (HicA-like mRNA interferase family)